MTVYEKPLTIRDYLDARLLAGFAPAVRSGGKRAASAFGQMLKKAAAQGEEERSEGMTAADYLARLVPAQHVSRLLRERGGAPAAAAAGTDSAPVAAATNTQAAQALEGASRRTAAGLPAAAGPAEGPASVPPGGAVMDRAIRQAAFKYGLTPELIRSVIRAESNFQADAVSPAGAQGLMQLMPETARELGVGNPFDVEQNVDGGCRYLRQMLDRFGGDLRLALAAYNAGPAAVEKYDGRVPYAETRQYVNRVLRHCSQAALHPYRSFSG
jgi:soluble lytic murein transglycosylase-like protein